MKLSILPVVAALALTVSAVVPQQKSVIVTYADHTPDNIIEDAMNAIRNAGGMITHRYKTIQGFAAQASEKALDTVSALSTMYIPIIETDQVVGINSNEH